MFLSRCLSWTSLAVAGCTLTAPLGAQTLSASPDSTMAARAEPSDTAFEATAVDTVDLDRVTGREDIGAMVASATQRNTVSNNSVTGTSSTGNVQIVGNAFQNLQGLAVISANSGNNVAMNAAMNVTVNLAPQ